jgi:hypothetical protein
MKGLYFYSPNKEYAYVYINTEKNIKPLPIHLGKDAYYDIAISYSSEDRDLIIIPLYEKLTDMGVKVYFLDVAEDPEDPVWSIRFREHIYFSYFFIPVLSKHYLARHGTLVELFDIAKITVKHRSHEFFYPLIPLLKNKKDLKDLVLSNNRVSALDYDKDSFEWVKTHIYSVEIEKGISWLAIFFKSLSLNAKNILDIGYLECLSSEISYVEFHSLESESFVRFFIKNPFSNYHCFSVGKNGIAKYWGMGTIGKNSKRVDTSNIGYDISTFLKLI